MPTAHDADLAAIRDWFTTWTGFVRQVDFISSRKLFHNDVIGFGTYMDVVTGLDALEKQQWRSIWPTIQDFQFLVDGMQAIVSPDRLQATAILRWSSTGFKEDGSTYPRNGRATVVLSRGSVDEPWLGSHTHVSLNPNTPQKSYGKMPERKAG